MSKEFAKPNAQQIKRNAKCECGWAVPESLMLHIDGKNYSSMAAFINTSGVPPKDPMEGQEAFHVFFAYECPQCGNINGEDVMHGNMIYDVDALVARWRQIKAEAKKTKKTS